MASSRTWAPDGNDPMAAPMNEDYLTQLAIVLMFFFGKEGVSNFPTKVYIVLCFLGVFILTSLIDLLTGNWLLHHAAIHSRQATGLLPGMLCAPFLHASPSATFIDCGPFMLLSLLVMLRPRGIVIFVTLVISNAVLGGLVVWGIGRSDTHHTGCGGMIFTLFGYLLFVGITKRDIRSSVISIAVFVMYGGLLWALLPISDRTISWEGHLMGIGIGSCLGIYDGGIRKEEVSGGNERSVKSSDVNERTGLTAKEEDDV